MNKRFLVAFLVMTHISFAQAGFHKANSSYSECISSTVSKAKLISRDRLLAICEKYQKTTYDNCQAFLISDGKWEQMFECRPDLKEGEVILQQNGEVVDVCDYMGWSCKN